MDNTPTYVTSTPPAAMAAAPLDTNKQVSKPAPVVQTGDDDRLSPEAIVATIINAMSSAKPAELAPWYPTDSIRDLPWYTTDSIRDSLPVPPAAYTTDPIRDSLPVPPAAAVATPPPDGQVGAWPTPTPAARAIAARKVFPSDCRR